MRELTIEQVTTVLDAQDVIYHRTGDHAVAARFAGPLQGITVQVDVDGPSLHLVAQVGVRYEADDTPRMLDILNSASETRHAPQVFMRTDEGGSRMIVYEQRLRLGVAPTQLVGGLIVNFIVSCGAHAHLVEQLDDAHRAVPEVLAELGSLFADREERSSDE